QELLLAAGRDLRVDFRIGDEPAARVAAVGQSHAPLHVHATKVCRLRHAPDVHAPVGRERRNDGDVFRSAPEIQEGVAGIVGAPVGFDANGAVDGHVVRRVPEPEGLYVESDLDVGRVGTGFEKIRVPARAVLGAITETDGGLRRGRVLLRRDLIELALNRGL